MKGFSLSWRSETNIAGFHDSALCCVLAVKNSWHIHSLPRGAWCDNIKQCFATIVSLRHIAAIKSSGAFGCFRLCFSCGFRPA